MGARGTPGEAHGRLVGVSSVKGEEISTHESIGDAMVYVLEGVGEYMVDGVKHEVKAIPHNSLAA